MTKSSIIPVVAEPRRLRAIVEIVGGELRIFPIADSDADEKTFLDALRFVREDFSDDARGV
jgi:hypothetical protein